MSNLKRTYFNLDPFVLKKLLKEQEEVEPIGGETKSPNEFAYFDFKSWAYEVGRKELFREKKFQVGEIEYTLEEATEMGAGIMFSVLTQIWTLWTEETNNDQFGRIKDDNVNDFGKALYNMMKKDNFFFSKEERGAKVGMDQQDADYLKQTYGVEMNEQEEGPSYDEVWLKDKLGDPTKDKYDFDDNRGHIDIYPDLGDMRAERSSQFIRFKLEEGTIHFVHAFGYERGYDMLKSALPELAPMSDSSFAGFMNVNTDGGTIPVGIDTANKMIDALRKGLDAEAGAQTDFYSSRGPTSGTIDEKKIGFNRGPEYSEEAVDLLGDLAKSADMLNKELEKKELNSDDPKVQEILNLLDDNLSVDSEFLTDIQTILDLIGELPDKPTERPKMGFRQTANELYIKK